MLSLDLKNAIRMQGMAPLSSISAFSATVTPIEGRESSFKFNSCFHTSNSLDIFVTSSLFNISRSTINYIADPERVYLAIADEEMDAKLVFAFLEDLKSRNSSFFDKTNSELMVRML